MSNLVHKFELINSNVFSLPPDNGLHATHLATVKWGMREFVYFRVDSTNKVYIEEVILSPTMNGNVLTAKYEMIEDDELWYDLAMFLKEQGISNTTPPFSTYYNPYRS